MLECTQGLSTVWFAWRENLGRFYEPFKDAFLKPDPGHPARFLPCPLYCGCWHEVIRRPDGSLGAECRCDPGRCDTWTATIEDITPLELDWPKLARALCQALDLKPQIVNLGFYNTLQIGCWAGDTTPVILTIATNPRQFLHVVTALIQRLTKPFILLAPTARHAGVGVRELLQTAGSGFFPLDEHISLSNLPLLSSLTPSARLFADFVPASNGPQEEDVARHALALLQRLDAESPTSAPTVLTVFRLYCIEELSVAQIRRRCRCSAGTVSNRLKLIQAKTGLEPKNLRRLSSHMDRIVEDMGTKRNAKWMVQSEE
jgi:hypothetical protein